jgi:choice-of-anchor A domain-containing protein
MFNAVAGPGNVAVFSMDSGTFSDPFSQQYELSMGADVGLIVVNVAGTSINFTQGNFTGAFNLPATRPLLIWNFPDATAINLDRSWTGSLIAPNATLRNTTSIDGSVFIGGDFYQSGEVHLPLYNGRVPDAAVPEPATIALTSIGLLTAAIWRRRQLRRQQSRTAGDN